MARSNASDKSELKDIFTKFINENEFTEIGKVLGKGAFGEVRDVKFKNKTMAGKITKRDDDEISEEEKYAIDLRGQNIIKINKIYTKRINGSTYNLIIMEKAILRDLGKLNEFYHKHNLLKLIFEPFDEKAGDNLLRFYSRQIVSALETLDRNYYIHYDIKPENLLITINLIIKLTDFSVLRQVKDGVKTTRIPGGTPGYLTPEYYVDREVTCDNARKQDYFALGSTLFLLKYGEQLLKYKKYDDHKMIADRIIDILIKRNEFIKSNKLTDKDFIKFLLSLISFRPEDRPSFEQIYRDKWLNKDLEQLNATFTTFENDEEKLIMELQKKDFLIKKEKEINEENEEKDNLDIKDEDKNELKNNFVVKNEIKKEFNKSYKFRFKKKKNNIN